MASCNDSVRQGSDDIVVLDSSAITVTCICDQGLQATFYCVGHDDVMCKICKTLKHKTCKVVSIKDSSDTFDDGKLSSLLESVKKLKLRNDRFLAEQNSSLLNVGTTKATEKDKIQAFRSDLNGLLDRLEYASIKSLKHKENKQLHNLRDKISVSEIIDEILKTDIGLLEDVQATNETDSQFAAVVKVSNRFRQCLSSFEDAFAKQGTPNLKFEADKELLKILLDRKTLGNISAEACSLNSFCIDKEEEKLRETIDTSFFNTAFRIHCHKNVYESGSDKEPDVSGCEIMPHGDVVLCDYANKRVIVLDSQTRLVLKDAPFDVSAANDTTAIITIPSVKQLQFVSIRPKPRLANKIQLDKTCWGIHVKNTNIYVSCFNTFCFGLRDGEIKILDMNGSFLRKLGLHPCGMFMFCHPQYLTVSSGKVFVTDNWDSTVTCLDVNGKFIYHCKDASLYDLRGICVDDQDNVIVVGRGSNNMLRINALGKGSGLVLKSSDGIKSPQCISYRRSINALIVGCYNKPNLVTLLMG